MKHLSLFIVLSLAINIFSMDSNLVSEYCTAVNLPDRSSFDYITAISADNQYIVTHVILPCLRPETVKETVKVFNMHTKELVQSYVENKNLDCSAISCQGTLYLANGSETPDNAALITNKAFLNNTKHAAFLNDTTLLALIDSTLVAYDTTLKRMVKKLELDPNVIPKKIITADPYCALYSWSKDAYHPKILLIDVNAEVVLREIVAKNFYYNSYQLSSPCSLSSSKKLCAWIKNQYQVIIVPFSSEAKSQALSHPYVVESCCFSPEGYLITGTNYQEGLIRVWDPESETCLSRFRTLNYSSLRGFSPITLLSCAAKSLLAKNGYGELYQFDWTAVRKTFEKKESTDNSNNNNPITNQN